MTESRRESFMKHVKQRSFGQQQSKDEQIQLPVSSAQLDLSSSKLCMLPLQSIDQSIIILILDHNSIIEFNMQVFKQVPFLNKLSLCDNLLTYFGPINPDDAKSLEILNIAKNKIYHLDTTIFQLALTKLFIQQNSFDKIPKQILFLQQSLNTLGFGWGLFTQPPMDTILQGAQLDIWFRLVKKMPNDITFQIYVTWIAMNYQKVTSQQTVSRDSVGDIQCESSNLLDQPQLKNSQTIGTSSLYLHNDNEIFTRLGLISLSIDSNYYFSTFQNEYKQNFMHLAVLFDEIGILRYLLNSHCHLANALDLKGHTPLSFAIEKHCIRLINIIIQYPVNVNIGGGLQQSVLHLAALGAQAELANQLLQLGANPSYTDIFGDTPLHICSKHNDHFQVESFYQVMLQYDIACNQQNVKGQSSLEILASQNNLLTLQFCTKYNDQMVKIKQPQKTFKFAQINPITQNSLIDICIIHNNISSLVFLINQNIILLTANNVANLYKNYHSAAYKVCIHKMLKKYYLLQNIQLLKQNNQEDHKFIDNSDEQSYQQNQYQSSIDNHGSSDDDASFKSETQQFKIAFSVQQLTTLKPKFQNSLNSSPFRKVVPKESEQLPEDVNCFNGNTKQYMKQNSLITKKWLDKSQQQCIQQQKCTSVKQFLKTQLKRQIMQQYPMKVSEDISLYQFEELNSS